MRCHDLLAATAPPLLPPALLHHQNLDHPDEDVQEVQLERDALVDRVPLDHAPLGKSCMVEHLLDIVEREATKHSQSSVQPDVLGKGQGSHGGRGDDQGREARGHDDSSACEERTADVQVLLLLGCRANDGDGAHHGHGVQAGAGDEGPGGEGKEGSDEGCLRGVEGGPESVLGDVAVSHKIVRACAGRRRGSRTFEGATYLSGSMALVPIMVPKLRARPPIATTQGFVTMSL